MRIMEAAGIKFVTRCYADTDAVSGSDVACVLGEDPDRCFKTLVTEGKSGEHYVFVIPVSGELDLRKAASSVGEKNIEMIKSKALLPLTGYIHGGCSPIGMKKQFLTVIDETAILYDSIMFSAGKIGYQVETSLDDLRKVLVFITADLLV